MAFTLTDDMLAPLKVSRRSETMRLLEITEINLVKWKHEEDNQRCVGGEVEVTQETGKILNFFPSSILIVFDFRKFAFLCFNEYLCMNDFP